MIISHVTFGFGMGGIETMLANIARYQAEDGHEVHIVILNDIVEKSLVDSLDPRVHLHLLGRPIGSRNPLYILRLNNCLRRLHPDVVHLHIPSLSKYILYPSLRGRFCVTQHAMCNAVNVIGLRSAGPVFAISDMVKKDLADKCGIEARTVYNGINLSNISFRPHKASAPFRIVQVGRLDHKNKGQDILLRAASTLSANGRDVRVTFIGGGDSLAYLESLAKDSGIADHVEFLGNRNQEYLFRHIADYDLLVQPSRFEGFGITVAEAMAAGIPVLVSDNDGPMEIIDGGRFGYHFRSGDTDDCARRIASIIDQYPSEQFLQNARKRVEESFSVVTTARRYVELYKSQVMR
ncbi:MAG: glycosyltransferase, partial [Muribaculaceae bacterium]|nr:glycosyltransferase [Muribaculaceae bacterium]